MTQREVRIASAPTAMIASVFRDIRALWANPMAFYGSLLATAASSAAVVLALLVFEGQANADEDDAMDIDFMPGALVKLGQKIEEQELPEKIITQETRAEDEAPSETVTEDDKAKPIQEKPKEPDKKPDKPSKLPDNKDKKLPTSKLPTKKNTAFDDLPTVDYNVGDPFGSPNGWSERRKDGDPWATAVMAALNNAAAGFYGAKGAKGVFKFQITICKDGKVNDVKRLGGDADGDTQRRVELELERLKLPRPPADVIKAMRKQCQRIPYRFTWNAGGVR